MALFGKKEENEIILPDKLPEHVGFIMDGNGRWAKKRGLPRSVGHQQGAKNFRKIVRHCKDIGLKTEVLRVTDNGFDLKTVFKAVYKKIGLLDHIIYGAMSLIVLLAHFVNANFFYFLMIQEAGFYELPIPRVLSFLLAVLCFAAEYALCLAIASKRWDKNRLHRGSGSSDH